MRALGITGGVGMGKSACAEFLRQNGVQVIDTDILARELVEPGQPALAEIERAFGAEMTGPDGHLRRDVLAKRVFSDSQARGQLENILHPRIRAAWKAQLEQWRAAGTAWTAVIIPLLFETNAEGEFDSIVCVACSSSTQRQRLEGRLWSPEQIRQRIAAQLSVDEKMARSHFVIWTEGSLDVHASQVELVLSECRVR